MGNSTRHHQFHYSDFIDVLDNLCRDIAPRREPVEYVKVFLVLRAWKEGMDLSVAADGTLEGLDETADSLTQRLVLLSDNDFSCFRQLFGAFAMLKKEEYDRRYLETVDHVMSCFPVQLFNGTTALPPFHISRTIASYLERHGCRSVFNPRAGISSLALALSKDISYSRQESSPVLALFGDILLDAAGITAAKKGDSIPDALVSILPVDYYFDEVDKWDRDQVAKGRAQLEFLQDTLQNPGAGKVIICLVHYQVTTNRSYSQRMARDGFINIRRQLAESGWLDMVITYPDDTFQDAKVLTSLVFLDLEKKDRSVTFITPEKTLRDKASIYFGITENDLDVFMEAGPSERAVVSIDDLNKTEYSFNAYVYVHPVECPKPYTLVRLCDIAEMATDDFQVRGRNGHTILSESFSSSVETAIRQVPLMDPKYVYSHYKKSHGPAVFFLFNKGGTLSACVNYTANECYFDDRCTVIRPKGTRVSPEYLAYLLLTNYDLRNTLWYFNEYYCEGGIYPYQFNSIIVPILDDPKLQEDELKMYRSGMPERFKEEFPEFFTAAEWIDGRFGMKVSDTISEYFRNNYSFPESSANRPFNTIRSLTHDLIRQMKELELVPPIDEGAVPTFLSDGKYKNRDGAVYELTRPFMDEDVVSALEHVCSVGSEGSHKIMIDGTNLRREILKGFMKFTQWIYGHKELFEKKGIGYFTEKTPYETSSKAGKKQITGTVRRVCIGGGEYLCCENVHLFVDRRSPKVKEGDTVIIRDYVDEGKKELREAGITLFAKNAKCYSKVSSQPPTPETAEEP